MRKIDKITGILLLMVWFYLLNITVLPLRAFLGLHSGNLHVDIYLDAVHRFSAFLLRFITFSIPIIIIRIFFKK